MIETVLILLAAIFLFIPFQRTLKVYLTSFTRRNKVLQNRKVIKIAKEILKDTNDALSGVHSPNNHPELRALIPIVADARRRIETMHNNKASMARWPAASQKEIKAVFEELIRIEKVLRSVPKSSLTLEQVLAGQFDETLKCLEVIKP